MSLRISGGDFTGGYIGLSGIPPMPPIAASPLAAHFLTWGCVAVGLFLYRNLLHSTFGRAVNTARHDALRAVADGVNVPGVLAAFFAASAAVAGLGGWLYAHESSYLAPESLSRDTALQALLMAIVGGARKPLCPIIGACVLLTIVTYLPAAESQGVVYGGELIFILLVALQGLVNAEWWSTWRHRDRCDGNRADECHRPSGGGHAHSQREPGYRVDVDLRPGDGRRFDHICGFSGTYADGTFCYTKDQHDGFGPDTVDFVKLHNRKWENTKF